MTPTVSRAARGVACLSLFVLSPLACANSYVARPYIARPYVVSSETTISNGDWYPLPVNDMKAAAVDSALSEFTKNGRFEIVRAGASKTDGKLQFRISLVGPAEVVKLATTLNLQNNATLVSSVSMNIHGLDYQGIYNAFEFVGTESAKRLNTKIEMLQGDAKAAGKGGDAAEAVSESASGKGNQASDSSHLFDRAQTLKRQEHYREARVLFEQIASGSPGTQWTTMAADELRYGLPIFEADNLALTGPMQDPAAIRGRMETVSHLYRQILADNRDNPQRVMDMNRRLDQMSLTMKQVDNVLRASSLSNAVNLRVALAEYNMSEGQWPEKEELEKLIHDMGYRYDVVSYKRLGDGAELVVRDIKYDVELQFSGNARGISMRLK